MPYNSQVDDFTMLVDSLGHQLTKIVKELKHLNTYAVSLGGTAFIPDGYTNDGRTKTEIIAAFTSLVAIVTLLEANGNAHWANINKIISSQG